MPETVPADDVNKGMAPDPSSVRPNPPKGEVMITDDHVVALNLAVAYSPAGVAFVDDAWRFTYVNAAICRILATTAEDLLGTCAGTIAHLRDRAQAQQTAHIVSAGIRQALVVEELATRSDGSTVEIRIEVRGIYNGDVMTSAVILAEELDANRVSASTIAHQTLGSAAPFPNRSQVTSFITDAVRHVTPEAGLGLLLLDVDHFKRVNDGLGHDEGDRLLNEIASRLRKACRTTDLAARFGSDEFVVIARGITSPESTKAIVEKIEGALSRPVVLAGRAVIVSASIGITCTFDASKPALELLQEADSAMYRAKELGRRQSAFFDHDLRTRSLERIELENDLRRALDNDELMLHFQPIMDLRTGEMSSSEALVRWEHPQRGLILPGAFIPIAEETGLIIPLGERVLNLALAANSRWKKFAGLAGRSRIGVNLSLRQLAQPGFIAMVENLLCWYGASPADIVFEVTESTLYTDIADAVSQLTELRQMGFEIAIDDFGTGFASLSALQELPVTAVKIDRSFVRNIEHSHRNEAMVAATIRMAHDLGLATTAEGIETADDLATIQRLGCRYAQGYYFARPMPEHELVAQHATMPNLQSALV